MKSIREFFSNNWTILFIIANTLELNLLQLDDFRILRHMGKNRIFFFIIKELKLKTWKEEAFKSKLYEARRAGYVILCTVI